MIFIVLKAEVLKTDIDFEADTINVLLVTNAYIPNQDKDDFKNDATNKVSGTGHTADGATSANTTVTQDNTNNLGAFDADDVTWSNSTITAEAL